MLKIKSNEKGIFIPLNHMSLPAGTEFSVKINKYSILLEPEGLTNKTAGLVRLGNIDIDNEIGRMIESRAIE
jgi:predicted DNA-binding antitoxin AbrB/MazE fold protein